MVEPVRPVCPLCLKDCKTLRFLGCGHGFCDLCIKSHTERETGKKSSSQRVDCPKCKQPTPALRPDKPPAERVTPKPASGKPSVDLTKYPPVTYTPVTLSEPLRAEKGSRTLCDNCALDNKSCAARTYCKGCKEYQCSDCIDAHSKYGVAKIRNHKMISVEEAGKVKSSAVGTEQLTHCKEHAGEEIKFYCAVHKQLLCSNCATVNHKACDGVTGLAEEGRQLEVRDRARHLVSTMATLQKYLQEIVNVFETNINCIENQADAIVQKITDIRDKAVQLFDDLKEKVIAQCEHLRKAHSTELAGHVLSQRSQIASIASSCAVMTSVLAEGAATQIFVAFHRLQSEAEEYKKKAKQVVATMSIVELQLGVEPELTALLQCTRALASVSVEQSKLGVSFPIVSPSVPVTECRVERSPLIAIRKRGKLHQPAYSGTGYLQDGRLVTADRINKLCCLLDEKYHVIAGVKLPSKPASLAVIGETDVAVVIPDSNTIQVVTIGNPLTLSRAVSCPRKPPCVTRAADGLLAVGWEAGFSLFTLEGEERKYIRTDSLGREIRFNLFDHIAVDSTCSRVYQSCYDYNSVHCFDLAGGVVFTYTDQLRRPAGLAVDRDGNVYVSSRDTQSVHQVGPAGSRISVITRELVYPDTVCFNQDGDEMLVTSDPTTQVLKIKFVPPV